MRIAVDVMGGDHGCGVIVAGAKLALEANPRISQLYLVGRDTEIKSAMQACGCNDSRIRTVHASQVLAMEDKPVVGIRKKKDCSILRAVELIKEGLVEAIVSPGNTGGVVAASTIRLRPLDGVDRPGIAAVMPAPKNEFVLIDAGANVECKPVHLLHYAIMGSVYSQEMLGYKRPRVGLLSVGTEEVKGNDLTLQAFKLCKRADINFIGNVEGYDLFANRVDVVVCDGFVGNIVLKTCEGLAKGMFEWLKTELTKTTARKAGAFLAKEAFRAIKRRTDADTYGGAPLLGLKGNVMIAHCSARENAIMNAIRVASEAVQNRVNQIITEKVAEANARLVKESPPLPSHALA
jgi:glycerol-3-phosphate acyltransferase PlsX